MSAENTENSVNVIIRTAYAEEANQLGRIAEQSKRHWNYPDSWFELWGDMLNVTAEFIQTNKVWVATTQEGIMGFIAISQDDDIADIEHMWVLPEHMGTGIGKLLVEKAIEYCKTNNITQLRIESDPNAVGFYEKMGGKKTGYVASLPEPRKLPVLVIEL